MTIAARTERLIAQFFPTGTSQAWRTAWWIGLAARLGLIFLATPVIYSIWFLPFLQSWAAAPGFDPWSAHLAAGGPAEAFPYGPPYVAIFGPPVALGAMIAGDTGAMICLGLTILLIDLALAAMIARLATPRHSASAYLIYWVNPITLFVCYWHGQLDVLPVALLASGLLAFRSERFLLAGLFIGVATTSKFIMGLALPFLLIAHLREARLTPRIGPLIGGAAIGLALFAPAVFSSGFRDMALGTPETAKLFSASLEIANGVSIYILPIVLGVLLLASWRIGRANARLIFAQIALAFLTVYLLTPASPGWALWLVPFLAMLVPAHGRLSAWLAIGFSTLIVLHHLAEASGAEVLAFGAVGPLPIESLTNAFNPRSAVLSGVVAAGVLIAAQILQHDILRDPFFRASRRPLSITVAGDSGSGKDTLAVCLGDMFGTERVAHLSGDDYHIWDRNKPMWQALTHLNPQANHLDVFFRDVNALLDGENVTKRHYDHSVGRMTRPHVEKSRDVVIVSGLHALRDPGVNARFDVRVFLDMDESLRQALKIRRDVLVRKHPLAAVKSSIARRLPDAARFVTPQRDNADLVFSLSARRRSDLEEAAAGRGDPASPIDTRLSVGVRDREQAVALQVDLTRALGARTRPLADRDGFNWFEIESRAPSRGTAFGARLLTPGVQDFLALQPKWADGLEGVMQLIVLDFLHRRSALDRSR